MAKQIESSPNYDDNNVLLNLSKWIPNFCINDSIKKAICFRENLIVHTKHAPCKETSAIGGYCISVENVDSKPREFLVNVSSSLSVEGQFGGAKLISSSNHSLRCLQEKRTEFLYTNNGYHEKELSICLNAKDCSYHVEVSKTCPCNKVEKDCDIPACKCNKFLCEGANIVLSRYLALKNFSGTFNLQNLNEEGRIVSCNYRCTAAKCKMLHGQCIDVYTVERRMTDNCEVQVIVTYMNRNGRILKHDWQSMPYVLEINPLLHPDFSKCGSHGENDVETMSKYVNDEEPKIDYLADHPEVKNLISEYVQTLLAVKPAEILTFTLQHILSKTQCGEGIIDKDSIFEGNTLKKNIRQICNLCGIGINTETSQYKHMGKVPSTCSVNSVNTDKDDVTEECTCEGTEESDSELSADKINLTSCNVEAGCENTCEGCKVIDRSKLNPCHQEDCKSTCEGCQISKLDTCDVKMNGEETCKSRQQSESIELKTCPTNTNCQDTCEGCKQTESPEVITCQVDTNCQETCRGCK